MMALLVLYFGEQATISVCFDDVLKAQRRSRSTNVVDGDLDGDIGTVDVRDIWAKTTSQHNGTYSRELGPHDSLFVVLTAASSSSKRAMKKSPTN